MKKSSKTPRFEVNYRERLQQARDASDAVRLPRLGYIRYRVYELPKKKDKAALNSTYGQHIGRGIRTGPLNVVLAGGQSLYYPSSTVIKVFLDDLERIAEPAYVVKWLKPKQATVLRLKGHRVEEHV